ncbi:MAG: hypothetical protein M1826_006375 [Phylliscum demangeonii]|nr:MAG: hypothetical protein M1826_006375 [Phylliscum demangeonii]
MERQGEITLLYSLPDELLEHIFSYLPAQSTCLLSVTSKRWNQVSNGPALWRGHCQSDFRYWDPSHQIRRHFAASVSSTDWKDLYRQRQATDRATTDLLNAIIARETGRILNYQAILSKGYDVKDTLLRHVRVGDDAPDVLARRYFSADVLSYVHRMIALSEWIKFVDGPEPSLERALTAFDLFLARDAECDFDKVSDQLDHLACQLRDDCPGLDQLPTRAKAQAVVSFLRGKGFRGVAAGSSYHALENNYIGLALSNDTHSSLPFISVAIYCAVAERVGLSVRPVCVPGHVYALVESPVGRDLDGNVVSGEEAVGQVYMDPFASEEAIPPAKFQLQWRESLMDGLVEPACTAALVIRAAGNIHASVQAEARSHYLIPPIEPSLRPMPHLHYLEAANAIYSALWVFTIFSIHQRWPDLDPGISRDAVLSYLAQHLLEHYSADAYFLQHTTVPILPDHFANGDLRRLLRAHLHSDRLPPVRQPRDDAVSVPYRIGQVFRHRRYGYMGVIIGWDATCRNDEDWIRRNRVDELPLARNQSFYRVGRTFDETMYVANENIEIVRTSPPPDTFLPWVGKYFLRYDAETGAFVSNMRDRYPDD